MPSLTPLGRLDRLGRLPGVRSRVRSRAVSPSPYLLIDDCETAWTVPTGLIRTVNATPTAGGSGYTAGDILTVTTGGAGGQVQVLTVDGGGAVTAIAHYAGGFGGYTTGAGKATSGGTGTGCTVNITALVNGSATNSSQRAHDGSRSHRSTLTSSSTIRALMGYRAISPGDLSAFSRLVLWFYDVSSFLQIDDGELAVCLCSDTVGRVVVDRFVLPAPLTPQTWTRLTMQREGGGPIVFSGGSIALYSTAVPHTRSTTQVHIDTIRVSA